MEHYGDSLLPYLPLRYKSTVNGYKKPISLPITVKSKIKYVKVRPVISNRLLWDRQTAFPDSTLRGPRREIRYATILHLSIRVSIFLCIFLYCNFNTILDLPSPVDDQYHLVI